MTVSFIKLKNNHYSSDPVNNNYLSAEEVYSEIGYDLDNLRKQTPAYENTCAVRMSIALLKSGVTFTGRLKVKAGELKDKSIEPGAKLLADQLMKPRAFGKPELYKPTDFLKKITGRKGAVLFWKITGYGGGHIDLINASNTHTVCNSHCYYNSKEIWFWELA